MASVELFIQKLHVNI